MENTETLWTICLTVYNNTSDNYYAQFYIVHIKFVLIARF